MIPTSTPGVEIGRRHFPLNVPFQNGPTRGKDIFVPIDYIIGGPSMAGQGWRMLVECLSVGRGITLPSNATGGLKSVAMATGAYAHIRISLPRVGPFWNGTFSGKWRRPISTPGVEVGISAQVIPSSSSPPSKRSGSESLKASPSTVAIGASVI